MIGDLYMILLAQKRTETSSLLSASASNRHSARHVSPAKTQWHNYNPANYLVVELADRLAPDLGPPIGRDVVDCVM